MAYSDPVNAGHHMVPWKAATELSIKPFGSYNNVSSMYFLKSGQWAGVEHSGLHGPNGIATETKSLVNQTLSMQGMTGDTWLKSLEAHYNIQR
jgi:hypothetical protein